MADRFSKGPLVPVLKRYRWFPLATPEKYGGSFLKNAIKDAPNLVISLGLSTAGLIWLAYLMQQDKKNPRDKDRPFKRFYTVYRPTDPRIENLKARPDYYNPEGTIPHYNDQTAEYSGWKGKKPYPVMADGRYANDIGVHIKQKPNEWLEKE